MPKRKQPSSDAPEEAFDEEAALQRVVERYDDVFTDGLNALNYGLGEEAFDEAMDSLLWGDEEEIEQAFAAWLAPFINEHIGARQRAAGRKGKGVRRDTYKGKPIPSPEKLLADVQRMHDDKRYRLRSFNWICNEVAKAHGYKSAGRVKEAAASIKWPDPRAPGEPSWCEYV